MAHSKQALKRARQSVRVRDSHKAERSALKTQLKIVRTAAATADTKTVATQLLAAQQKIDKAAKHNVLHRNAAARLKSRLTKRANALSAAKT